MLRKIDYSVLVAMVALAVAVSSTASAGLVGWWKFDETSGSTAKDSSGSGNDGTIVGTPTWVQGTIGGALQFNGSTYVDCGNKASLNIRNQISMSFWFKVKAFSNSWETFLAKGDGAYRAARSGGTGNATHMGVTASNYFDAPTVITDDKWHHYAGIFDGTVAKIYIDGKLDASMTYSGQIGDSSSYKLYIGENAQATGRYLHGLLDDVRIYDRALTEQQLLDLINNGISPSWNKAEKPEPADGATGVASGLLKWNKGDAAVTHNIYVGTTPELTAANLVGSRKPATSFYYTGELTPGATFYWRVDGVAKDGKTIYTGDVWKFTAAPLTAYFPNPRNGDKWIATDVTLTWQPGQLAMDHMLYFGTDKAAVESRDASVSMGSQPALTYTPPAPLNANTTYYWAVDEITADTTNVGELWKFTTVGGTPGGVKAEYWQNMTLSGAPFLTQIEPAIDHSWGDPGGPTANVVDNFSARWTADLEIAIADTYTFITTSDDGVRLWLNDQLIVDNWTDHAAADNYSLPMALEPGIYSLRMEYYENTASAVAQLSWQSPNFARQIIPAGPLQPPVRAKPINPVDKDVNVPQDVTLMWSVGENAVTHEIYFGEDQAAVEAATTADTAIYKGSQSRDENTWTPGALEWNKTYYWRIDEVNEAAEGSPWTGAVWSFTTADFVVVDNFESYTDEDVGRIFQTWIDGWGYTTPAPGNPGNGTGSTVGYTDPPFAEHAIVHGGGSSMPLAYNNADSPYYSEAERTFDTPQNWTINGVTTLSIAVRGYPEVNNVSVTETGGKMTLTGSGTDIWGTSDQFTYAYKTLNGDGTIVAKVTSIGAGTNTWAKGGVMIRASLNGNSASAQMCLTANSDGAAGNGATFQNRATTGLDMSANDATSNTTSTSVIAPPYWVKIERVGDTFNGYVSSDGNSWAIIGSAGVVMSDPVYIGLCVTAHIATEQRTFQFDSIKTTGSVTGAWQGAAISSPRYNSAQNLYVALQDSAGKLAVVTDTTAVNSATWVEVKMPLSGFTGVSMTKVKKIFVGVGNRNNPAADGTGMLYIDDIRIVK